MQDFVVGMLTSLAAYTVCLLGAIFRSTNFRKAVCGIVDLILKTDLKYVYQDVERTKQD